MLNTFKYVILQLRFFLHCVCVCVCVTDETLNIRLICSPFPKRVMPEKSIIKRSRVMAISLLFNEFIKITCYCVQRAFSPKCFLFLQQDMGFFVP